MVDGIEIGTSGLRKMFYIAFRLYFSLKKAYLESDLKYARRTSLI